MENNHSSSLIWSFISKKEFTTRISKPRGLTFVAGLEWYCHIHKLTYDYDVTKGIIHFRKRDEDWV